MKVIKYVFGVLIILASFGGFFEGKFVIGLTFLVLGVILLPPISEKIKETLSTWNNKAVRYAVYFGLLVIGGMSSQKIREAEEKKSPEYIVKQFIKNNKENSLIAVIDSIRYLEATFDENSILQTKNNFVVKQNKVFYNPKLSSNNELFKDYQKPINGKFITDYDLVFELTDSLQISNIKALVKLDDNSIKEFNESELPKFSDWVNYKEVLEMEKAKAKLFEAQKQYTETQKNLKEFEEKCFNTVNDGSHRELKKFIKENLNDPSSFEYVETRFKVAGNYAIVIMTYRAKNSFNAIITKQVKAKIKVSDCSIIEILE